jgi:hypothetical protein
MKRILPCKETKLKPFLGQTRVEPRSQKEAVGSVKTRIQTHHQKTPRKRRRRRKKKKRRHEKHNTPSHNKSQTSQLNA